MTKNQQVNKYKCNLNLGNISQTKTAIFCGGGKLLCSVYVTNSVVFVYVFVVTRKQCGLCQKLLWLDILIKSR